jgi:hypothetical protein
LVLPGGRDRSGAPRCRAALLAGILFLAAGCEGGGGLVAPSPLPPPSLAPRIARSVVAENPANVLSVVVTARVRFADSVSVRYRLSATAVDSLTPATAPADDSVSVSVLGLLPDTSYVFQLVAYGGGRLVTGDTLTLRTGALPTDLPAYVAAGPDPSAGYVVFAAGRYGLVVDNTGRVVWYRRFEFGAGLSFAAQPTGRYTARPVPADPTDAPVWLEIDSVGIVARALPCARGLASRPHDVILRPDGSYWLMCDDTRTLDLSGMGGLASAQVTGTAIQHVGANGALLFSWTPFDHFDIADLPPSARSGAAVNWTHGNSLDLDADGNVTISFRNLSEVAKIDVATGTVLWRMGGTRNQFAIANTAVPAFARQHGLRLTGPGQLLLLDNYGDSLDSRAELYEYDVQQRTVSLVASYGSRPPVTAQLGGSVQALPNGRTLVSFGTAGRVEEYDAAGNVVWRIEGNPGYVFRAQRIRSLYAPGVGLPR